MNCHYLATNLLIILTKHVIKTIQEVGLYSSLNKALLKYITSVDKSHLDFITLYFVNKNVICGTYIPPTDSAYFSEQFEYLEALINQAAMNHEKILIVGDENCRLGDIRNINQYSYTKNPDATVNAHGQKMLNMIQKHHLVPINHLITKEKTLDGGFTFKRGDHRSQIDWAIVNSLALDCIKNFTILSDFPDISDHTPVAINYYINTSIPIGVTYDSICDITREKNNHSHRKNCSLENVDKILFNSLCGAYLEEAKIGDEINSSYSNYITSKQLNDVLYRSAKEATINDKKTPDIVYHHGDEYELMKREINETERKRWDYILRSKDQKKLWHQIDWNGELNKQKTSEHEHNEYAEVLEKRSSCKAGEDFFEDINTNIFNPVLDGRITKEEIEAAAKKMKRSSKSNTGISSSLLLLVLNNLLLLLTTLFNNIFMGLYDKYPSNWLSAVKCIGKKGQFNIAVFRGISMKEILAKLYDSVLMTRLQKWLWIPHEQTAYQKGKGCAMHVFFVRALIAIAKKAKKPLFIGVTDFTAAFDTISRRRLFMKLAHLGIGMFMLNALKDMYSNTLAYVSIQGEYSDIFPLKAGVLQGSATSTLLFMAYTSDIITIFNTIFAKELYVHTYHLLLHADDSLILASTKQLLIDKYCAMETYCVNNMLNLQPKKCGFICINSTEKSSFPLKNGLIDNLHEISYLGSKISSNGNIDQDIRLEIESKMKHFSKFYIFLSKNTNAPMIVKTKVLESCVCSALLYNCETWGDANILKLEKKYTDTLKYMLHLRKQTCNEFPYIELGLMTLKAVIKRRQYRFYKNITTGKDWPLLRHIMRQSRDVSTNYIKYYDDLLQRYGNEEELIQDEIQKQKECILEKGRKGKSKYMSYIAMNPHLKKSNIYEFFLSTSTLQNVIRLRTVSHSLAIETGRHGRNRKPLAERLCHCGEVESEEHFIQKCMTYEHIRRKYNINQESDISEVLESDNIVKYVNDLHQIRSVYT